jgi:hypothetical protein
VYECVARYRWCCCSLSNSCNIRWQQSPSWSSLCCCMASLTSYLSSACSTGFCVGEICHSHGVDHWVRHEPSTSLAKVLLVMFVLRLCPDIGPCCKNFKDLQHSDQPISLTSTADVIRFAYQRLCYIDKERTAVQGDFHIVVYIVHVYRVVYLKIVPTTCTIQGYYERNRHFQCCIETKLLQI